MPVPDSATTIDISPKSRVCVNPECENGRPHYKDFGAPSTLRCFRCNENLRNIEMEPRD